MYTILQQYTMFKQYTEHTSLGGIIARYGNKVRSGRKLLLSRCGTCGLLSVSRARYVYIYSMLSAAYVVLDVL